MLNLLGLGRYGAVTPRDMFHQDKLLYIEWRGTSDDCSLYAPIRLKILVELGDSQYVPGPTCFGNDRGYLLPLFISVLVFQATKTKWMLKEHRNLIANSIIERLCWRDDNCTGVTPEYARIDDSMKELFLLAELYHFDGNGQPDIESSFIYSKLPAVERRDFREEIDEGRTCTMIPSSKLDPRTFSCGETCEPDVYSVAATTDYPFPEPDPEPDFDAGESWEPITVTITRGSSLAISSQCNGPSAQYNYDCTQDQVLPPIGPSTRTIYGRPVITTHPARRGVTITGSAGGDQWTQVLSEGGYSSSIQTFPFTNETCMWKGTFGPYHYYPGGLGTNCAQGNSVEWHEVVGRTADGREVFRLGGPQAKPSPENPDPDECGPGTCTYSVSFKLSASVSLPVTLNIRGVGGAIRTFRHNMSFDLPLGEVSTPSFCGPDVPDPLLNYAANRVGDGLSLVADTIVDAGLTWAFPVAGKILAAIVDIEIEPTVTKNCPTS